MRNVGNIAANATSAYRGAAPVSPSDSLSDKPSAIAAFQKTGPNVAGLSSNRGYTGLGSPSLSSQTTSTLIQEQDVTQLEEHGHGGGGGHGGGMKGLRNIEAEEAAGSEEAQQMKKRKKLSKPGTLEDAKQPDETGESDEAEKNGKPAQSGPKRWLNATRREEEDRGVWGWL